MYAKILNNTVSKYPYTLQELYEDNPTVGFPTDLTDDILTRHNAARIIITGQPEHDRLTHKAVEMAPVFSTERNRWEQAWNVVPLSAEEVQANVDMLQQQIVGATQNRLDEFARTRGYDSILSACTYINSSITKFQYEAQYCVRARDETWASLHQILAEVVAGKRPIPEGYQDIEQDLPTLAWPV